MIPNKFDCPHASGGEIVTCDLLWDCECRDNYIISKDEYDCPICGAYEDMAPDARCNEVIRHELCPLGRKAP